LPKKERYPGTGGCSFSCSSPVTMSREDQTASRMMFQGMISWFVIDSAGAFTAHLPGNVILNMVFLTDMASPK